MTHRYPGKNSHGVEILGLLKILQIQQLTKVVLTQSPYLMIFGLAHSVAAKLAVFVGDPATFGDGFAAVFAH